MINLTGFFELIAHPAFLAIIGLLFGSFLNVVIYRVPLGMHRQCISEAAEVLSSPIDASILSYSILEKGDDLLINANALHKHMQCIEKITISKPRSRCPSCSHLISWKENIPVISWILLKAKCSSCSTKISARYPAIELLTSVVFVLIAHVHPGAQAFWLCGASAALIALAMIDFDTMLLPDSMTLPLLWVGLLGSAFGFLIPLQSAVIGAAVGYLCLWSLYWVFKLMTGKEGMGYGDFKLMAALGAWLGFSALPTIAIVSAFVGIVSHIVLRILGKMKKDEAMPYGPCLAFAGIFLIIIPASTFKII